MAGMATITLDEIERHHPDVLLPPDPEFAEDYAEAVRAGREIAKTKTVALVAICRSAMPWLPLTLELVEQTGAMFREWSAFIYENDSADETKDVLAGWSDGQQRHASLNDNGRPHLNYTTEPVRTHALAEYRSACQTFVRNGERPDYVIVFDTDPWGGWSVDGVATSVAHMAWDHTLYGLASYSWGEWGPPLTPRPMAIHYDAFACRLNHWRQRDQQWFHHWHPPVGSPPVEVNSAFGQLAIYDGFRFLQGRYDGSDCEHVTFARSIQEAAMEEEGDYYHGPGGTRMALNPSMRCVSFWIPEETKRGG
jgi:hypothetical protein